jgi:formylglycine-generating enzyme required for sulfatase activity
MSVRTGSLALLVPLAVAVLATAVPAAPAPADQPKEITNSIGMKLVPIPKGKFVMGMPKTETILYGNEPEHEVEITKPFYLGAFEVTQAEYEKVTRENPSQYRADGKRADKVKGLDTKKFPVEYVSWEEAVAFCKALTDLPEEKKAGRVYRLPTEAEWEYACRAGTKTRFSFGDKLSVKDANCCGKFTTGDTPLGGDPLDRPTTVGAYKPNPWGLYDMHGNVWEWCSDWYQPDYYTTSPKQDPPGPEEGSQKRRVRRGGDFGFPTLHLRSGARFPYQMDKYATGLRVVCTVAAP